MSTLTVQSNPFTVRFAARSWCCRRRRRRRSEEGCEGCITPEGDRDRCEDATETLRSSRLRITRGPTTCWNRLSEGVVQPLLFSAVAIRSKDCSIRSMCCRCRSMLLILAVNLTKEPEQDHRNYNDRQQGREKCDHLGMRGSRLVLRENG